MWQELREELHPQGLEVVTVGMDTAGADACRPFVEAARPRHPSLVDVGHALAEQFGVVNVPSGVWIDEDGVIVRPAEPAWPGPRDRRAGGGGGGGRGGSGERPRDPGARPPDDVRRRLREMAAEAGRIQADAERYAPALRDWVAHGRASRYALAPDEVVARSGGRGRDEAEAAAHFALAQHLWRAGERPGAVEHFRAAHRLQPGNFTYKRQAWSLEPAGAGVGAADRYWQGPVPGREDEWPYESDWLTEVRAMGAERYYPPLDL